MFLCTRNKFLLNNSTPQLTELLAGQLCLAMERQVLYNIFQLRYFDGNSNLRQRKTGLLLTVKLYQTKVYEVVAEFEGIQV